MSSHNPPTPIQDGGASAAGESGAEAAPPAQEDPQEGDGQQQDMYHLRSYGVGGQYGLPAAGFPVNHFVRFSADPIAFLDTIASQNPSPAGLEPLAGQVANHVRQLCQQQSQSGGTGDLTDVGRIAFMFLKAVSKHLTASTTGTAYSSGQALYQKANHQGEVLRAVGPAAACLKGSPSLISRSGILASLAYRAGSHSTKSGVTLEIAHVEFLQCCIFAGQYRFADRIIRGIWPLPGFSSGGAEQVIRFYLYRGIVHVEGEQWELAHRCFWTCLSVPSDLCSAFAIEAWKKLILVQCVLHEKEKLHPESTTHRNEKGSGLQSAKLTSRLSVPPCMPDCLGQLLTQYRNPQMSMRVPKGQPKHVSKLPGRLNRSHPVPRNDPHRPIEPALASATENPIAPYMNIAKSFLNCDKVTFASLANQNSQTLSADGNLGLIEECAARLVYCQVAHFATVYSVVSRTKLSRLLGIEESNVLSVLCKSRVPCEIQDDGMVVFPDFELPLPSQQALSESLSFEGLSEWTELMVRMQKLDAEVGTSSKYLSARKDNPSSKGGGPRGVDDI